MNEVENYKSEICSLFSDWKSRPHHYNQVFNYDGIIDPKTWFHLKEQNKPRILFVLKEAYHTSDFQGTEYDLADDLRTNGPWGSVWLRVAEWAYGLMFTTTEKLQRYKELSSDEANNCLRQIAILNLKKSNGKSSSQMDDIGNYAKHDADLIQREIELISPNVIVCGYTFEALNSVLNSPFNKSKAYCDNWYYRDTRGRIFLDYYHPANHYPALMNYYGLTAIYQQALLNSAMKD